MLHARADAPCWYISAISANSLATRGSGACFASCAMACAKALRTEALLSAFAAASRACVQQWCFSNAVSLHFLMERLSGLPYSPTDHFTDHQSCHCATSRAQVRTQPRVQELGNLRNGVRTVLSRHIYWTHLDQRASLAAYVRP